MHTITAPQGAACRGEVVWAFVCVLVASSALSIQTMAAAPLTLRLLNQTAGPSCQRLDFEVVSDALQPDAHHPARAHLDLQIQVPSGEPLTLPVFPHQRYEVRRRLRHGKNVDWLYPVGAPRWEARFTPTEVGRYAAFAVLRLDGDEHESEPLVFEAAPPAEPAFVRTHPTNPRFFATPDGDPVFPLGLNLAFIGSGQYLDLDRLDTVLGKLAGNGANFARVWTGCEDWGLGIEARKSAWGRSWDWSPPFVPAAGGEGYHQARLVLQIGGSAASSLTLSPTTPIGLVASTRYRLSGKVLSPARSLSGGNGTLRIDLGTRNPLALVPLEGPDRWHPFEAPFVTAADEWWLSELTFRASDTAELRLGDLSLREAAGGPELLHEADPNAPNRGRVNLLDCALLDKVLESAERHGIRLQLCLFTRDHYRRDLAESDSSAYTRAIQDAQDLLRYAVARWGYSPNVFAWEYFNEMDPSAPTARFHTALGHYLKRIDPYRHLRTTSGWGPAPAHWTHPELDIADLHWYLRPSWGELSKDAVGAVLDRTRLLRQHAPDRPAVLGEFGLADDRWGPSPSMRRDRTGIHFHNALWASAFSGLSAGASFWWWETVDELDYYGHFQPLARFLRTVPWIQAGLQPMEASTLRGSRVLLWRSSTAICGWIANPQASWWKRVEELQTPTPVESDELRLSGLAPGIYALRWWNTWQGTNTPAHRIETAGSPPLLLPIPTYVEDLAFDLLPVTPI